jgi:hypothetical protein
MIALMAQEWMAMLSTGRKSVNSKETDQVLEA